MALRILGRLKTTVAIGPSCCTRMSALGVTVVQCSRGTPGPSLRRRADGTPSRAPSGLHRLATCERIARTAPRVRTILLSREIPAAYDRGRRRDAVRHADSARAAPRSDDDDLWGYTNVYLASADRTTYAGARMATVWRTSGFLESNLVIRAFRRAHGVAPKIFRAVAGPIRLRPRPVIGTPVLEIA